MKKILMIGLLITAVHSYGQSFEGTLTYIADIEVSENMLKIGLTKQLLVDKMKEEGSWSDTIRTSYKQGNYYTLLNGKPKVWTIYKSETNKIYTMQDGDAANICTVTDASIDLEFTMTGKLPLVQKQDTVIFINGVECSVVRVAWASGTYDYYYNAAKLAADPALFAGHVYDAWADFLKISRALPLKIVKTTKGMMTITMTLVSATTEAVQDKLFSIPPLVSDKALNKIKVANREVMRIKR